MQSLVFLQVRTELREHLFGNGERTGNVDIITLAMNMYAQGVNPELDLSNMPELTETFERLTQMKIDDRHPYCR